MVPAEKPMISFCVCTADRIAELECCLESFASSGAPVHEVIVADDSADGRATAALCARYPFARYVRGPRRGLWANRNTAIRASSGDWLSFLDDDGTLGRDFIQIATELIRTAPPDTIFTGDLDDKPDGIYASTNLTFLGFFGSRREDDRKTVHINSCLFPRSAFRRVAFDETLSYGLGDADLAYRLWSYGFTIVHTSRLLNTHERPDPSPTARARRDRVKELARFYMNTKRLALWERSPLRALAFMGIGTAHQALHHLRHGRISAAARVPLHMAHAGYLVLRYALGLRSGRHRGALAPARSGAHHATRS